MWRWSWLTPPRGGFGRERPDCVWVGGQFVYVTRSRAKEENVERAGRGTDTNYATGEPKPAWLDPGGRYRGFCVFSKHSPISPRPVRVFPGRGHRNGPGRASRRSLPHVVFGWAINRARVVLFSGKPVESFIGARLRAPITATNRLPFLT